MISFKKKILIFCGFLSLSAYGDLFVMERPSLDMRRFEDFTARAMATCHVPGASIAVVKDCKVLYAHGFGYRDVEHKLPVTPETIFGIGSCTKAFTATALGMLVDQGKLGWDVPIKKYLPSFEMYDKEVTEKLSLRDCLCHRSGLPRYDCLLCHFKNRAELVDRLRYLKPNVPFREKWQYNNFMYVLAGHVLETISGLPWETFVHKYITEPLGMHSTYFSASVVPTHPNAALAYEFDKESQSFKQVPYHNLDVVSPAGALHSSALDMAQWVIANLQNRGINAEIHKPHIVMDEIEKVDYCLGWGRTPRGEIIHNGGTRGIAALVGFLPKEQLGFVVLSNIEDDDSEFDELLAKYAYACMTDNQEKIRECEKTLSEKAGKKHTASQPEEFQKITPDQAALFVGTYHNDVFGDIVISAHGAALSVLRDDETIEMGCFDENTFKGVAGENVFHFKRNASGIPACFTVEIEKGCEYEFVRV